MDSLDDEDDASEYEETTCDDCGAEVFIDAEGQLFDDAWGAQVHDPDCATADEDSTRLHEILTLFVRGVDELDELEELPKSAAAAAKRLRSRARELLKKLEDGI